MVWGQIAGAVAGAYMSNRAAKKQAAAMDRANQMSNMGYLDAQPYTLFGYKGGQGALKDVLKTGAYGGPTYAGLNDMQMGGLNNQFNMGSNAFNMGNQLAATGSGFGSNYQNLYDQAQGGQAMDNAIAYANENSSPLVDAALRDSTRMLTEQTMPGINRAASASGNANSSRAGIADAMAVRDYSDRAADTSANIQNKLINQSLTQQQNDFSNAMSANRGLANTFTTGLNTGFKGAGQMINAGGALQKDEQNRMNDDRENFERQRDFEFDQYNKFMGGILGRAPTSGNRYTPNLVDPTMAAASGAMAGYGFGNQLFGGGGSNFGYNPGMSQNMGSRGMGFGNNPYGF